jgi:hypothetical protein
MSDTSDEAITAAVRRVLCGRGPMSEDELLGVLTTEGVDLGSEPDAMLAEVLDEEDEPFMSLADQRWAWIPAVLDERIFTHRLTEAEAVGDILVLDVDLSPLEMLTGSDAYRRLSDGSPITAASSLLDNDDVLAARGISQSTVDSDEVLLLPSGRFDVLGVGAGDLVGVRVSTHGLELTKVSDPEVTPCDLDAALGALFDEQGRDQPEMVDVAVWTVCARNDQMFCEPSAPLGDLLAASELAWDGHWVAPRGFDFDGWYMANRIETLQARYALSDDEALAVLVTVRLYEQTRNLIKAVKDAHDSAGGDMDLADIVTSVLEPQPDAPPSSEGGAQPELDPDRATVRATLEFLAEPVVATAVLAETGVVRDRSKSTALGLFAETVEPMAPRSARPALRWLRAKAYEGLGDIEQAEATLQAAESLDPVWPLTVTALARYASDRGDAESGLALLRRAGAPPDDELVVLLEHFQSTPRPGLGRNERCWCGSGRKYKVCHLRREQLPLEDRAAWLYQKAGHDLADGPFMFLLLASAQARARYWEFPDALERAIQDGLVCDAVLFEGGAFAEFLDVRGSLLPDDERLLAQQWLLVQRSVYEVLAVARGQGFTVRDVRTGDIHEVRERAGSTQVKTGQFYCARVVPVGDTMQIFGGIEPVSLSERDKLTALLDDDPDPVELVAALSRRFAPPTLLNTEGESLMMCDATLRVDDPAALTQALDDAYDRDDDEPDGTLVWYEHVITHGMQRIRAHIELNGDQLHVHANSTTRFERVLATIDTLDPSATVLRETRQPAGDLHAVRRLGANNPALTTPAPRLEPTDPAIVAALDDMMRKYEQAWLDEPIPALAGHTPRQCAHDPTRRDDLIRLLDSFPQDTNQPGMSPTRLRAVLGLN